MKSVSYPDVPDMTPSEKIHWEKSLLGFYVSGHPLDDYKKVLDSCTPIYEINSHGMKYDGKMVSIGGTVARVKGKLTKKGQPMGYATIEDYDDAIETVIFPSVWAKAKPLLDKMDAIVCVRGRVQANERDGAAAGRGDRSAGTGGADRALSRVGGAFVCGPPP